MADAGPGVVRSVSGAHLAAEGVLEIGRAAPNVVYVQTKVKLYLFIADRLPIDRALDEYGLAAAQDRLDRGVQTAADCAASFGYENGHVTAFAKRLRANGWRPKSVQFSLELKDGIRERQAAARDPDKAVAQRAARARAYRASHVIKHIPNAPPFMNV